MVMIEIIISVNTIMRYEFRESKLSMQNCIFQYEL